MSEKLHYIACPQCDWEPTATSRWYCTCGCQWNTFDTGGICPSCQKKWKTTQCISCHKHSPHNDWYRNLSAIVQEELDSIFTPQPFKTI